jgi:hypothetical protein
MLVNQNIVNDDENPKSISRKYTSAMMIEHEKKYQEKVMHGYIQRKIEQDNQIDKTRSQSWLKDRYLTSHFTAYACAIQEQEIATKYLINKRQKDNGMEPTNN